MRRMLTAAASAAALTLVITGCTDMDPPPSPVPTVTETAAPPSVLPDVAPPLPLDQLAQFSAVATMNAGSNCTGTLIDTGVPTGPAYILTNGHCVGDVGRSRQQTTVDLEWFGDAEFFRAEGNLNSTYTVPVIELAYSTMRYTDTAIVRLDATLGEVESYGVAALPITASEPSTGAQVVNVGVPVQDLPDDQWIMRRGDCTLAEQHTIIEFGWLWKGVWANDCPGIIQGSSGSPLLEVDASGTPTHVVGLINTTSWGVSQADGGACFINRPCQVAADGTVTMVEETSYAQSVAGIGECFSPATGEFSLGRACPLPASTIWTEHGGGAFQGGSTPDATGGLPESSFVGASAGTFRAVTVPLGDATACADPATYAGAAPQVLPQGGEVWELLGLVVAADLPEVEGWYAQCAVRGEDYDGAATVTFEVDRTPPLFEASAEVDDIGDGHMIVRPHLNPPELTTVRFTWGPAGTVDCSNTAAFQDFFIVPLNLDPSELPVTYCIYGLDAAGNTTPVTQIDIPAS